MGTKSITASANAMRRKKDQLIKYNDEFKKALDTMQEKEQILVKVWTGEASQSFDKTYQDDHANLLDFVTVVKEYADTLEKIIAAYEKTEQKNAGLFNK